MAIRTSKEIKDIVYKYYLSILKAGFPLDKVILFGSYSRNDQKENSDIDIAVVLKNYSNDRFTTRLELMKLSRDFEEVIEAHPFLSTDLNNSNPFITEILKEGIEIPEIFSPQTNLFP